VAKRAEPVSPVEDLDLIRALSQRTLKMLHAGCLGRVIRPKIATKFAGCCTTVDFASVLDEQ
jgi:hypothetical protein